MRITKLKKRLETLESMNSDCIIEYLPFEEVQKIAENEPYKLISIKPVQGTINDMIQNKGIFKRIVSGGTVKALDKILDWNLQRSE